MSRFAWLASIPLLALPALAMAADGYTTTSVNMRAGPDISYPWIDTIPAGAPVAIQGCTDGWAWCDVIYRDERGWVAGNFIQYIYDNQNVLVPRYGARIGIPIISFVIGTYWGHHYRDRPFYRERDRWYARPVPHRAPPRPAYRPVPPHHGAFPRPLPRPTSGPVRPVPGLHARPLQSRPYQPVRSGQPMQTRPAPSWHGHDRSAPASRGQPNRNDKGRGKDQHGH
ncbi:SH3 domain-containing protein [Dyella sp. A6]|uniref:SH3 domain-containing protein n=1 Tax=Dyella aluminiiresistens TaxID=3069105 RepID=UPI002E75C8A7|nr:SH3 domain-containing protein [Dyella sp. A6]